MGSWDEATIVRFAEDRTWCKIRFDGEALEKFESCSLRWIDDSDKTLVHVVLPDHCKDSIRIRVDKTLEIKCDQAKQIRKIISELKVPAIYACDFNSNPTTVAYETLINATEDEPLQLASAYETVEVVGEVTEDVLEAFKPPKSLRADRDCKFSSAKWRKGGEQKDKLCKTVQTIDFILTTGKEGKKDWKCHAILDLPTLGQLEKTSPLLLPSWKYPSDHEMIGAVVELIYYNRGAEAEEEETEPEEEQTEPQEEKTEPEKEKTEPEESPSTSDSSDHIDVPVRGQVQPSYATIASNI